MKNSCALHTVLKNALRKHSMSPTTYFAKRTTREELPPTVDSLGYHITQANYQTYVWKQAILSMLTLPSPDGNGQKLEEDKLVPVLMSKYSAPKSIIELTTCHCNQSARAWNCSCEVNSLSCTEACMCTADENCHNPWNEQATSISEDSSASECER